MFAFGYIFEYCINIIRIQIQLMHRTVYKCVEDYNFLLSVSDSVIQMVLTCPFVFICILSTEMSQVSWVFCVRLLKLLPAILFEETSKHFDPKLSYSRNLGRSKFSNRFPLFGAQKTRRQGYKKA